MTFSRSVHRQGNLGAVPKNQRNDIRGTAMYQGARKGNTKKAATFVATRARCATTNKMNAAQSSGRMLYLHSVNTPSLKGTFK